MTFFCVFFCFSCFLKIITTILMYVCIHAWSMKYLLCSGFFIVMIYLNWRCFCLFFLFFHCVHFYLLLGPFIHSHLRSPLRGDHYRLGCTCVLCDDTYGDFSQWCSELWVVTLPVSTFCVYVFRPGCMRLFVQYNVIFADLYCADSLYLLFYNISFLSSLLFLLVVLWLLISSAGPYTKALP